MVYSVFKWDSGHYHYFEGPGEGLGIRPQPKATLADINGRGHQLESLLPVVPAGSKPAGEGDDPRGRIAIMNTNALSGFGATTAADTNPLLSSPWLTLGLWTGAMFLAYKLATWAGQHVARSK